MRKLVKRVLSGLLAVGMAISLATMSASASEVYYANGKAIPNSTIKADGSNPWCTSCASPFGSNASGNHGCCWVYASAAYAYIWDKTFDRTVASNDMLRNCSVSERTVTVEHLKAYFSSAVSGANVRFITTSLDEASNPHSINVTEENGHSLIFLGVTSSGDGAYFLEGNYDNCGRSRIAVRTWSSLANKYSYIKYIMWPNAPAYSGGTTNSYSSEITISGATEPSSITVGSTFSCKGTISSGAKLTKVVAGIYDVDGKAMSEQSATPNSTSYDIKNIDKYILFDKLDPGVYRYTVTATNSSGSKTLVNKVFTVLAKDKTIPTGTYFISPKGISGMAVSIADDSLESGANLQVGVDENSANQAFYIAYSGSGYYTIRNYASGKYLDVSNSGTTSNTNVTQFNYTGNSNQQWQILPVGNSYCLVPRCAPNLCLDRYGGGTASGTNLEVYAANLTVAQRFSISSTEGDFKTGNRIYFYSQGGNGIYTSLIHVVQGFNTDRGENQLIVYNVPGLIVPTNIYGYEAAVSADGQVVATRGMYSEEKLTVPEGGFVFSGHDTAGSDFVAKFEIGTYVGIITGGEGSEVVGYESYSDYLMQHKYVSDGETYGDLPTPERDGYSFDGWYTEKTGGTLITSDSIYSANELYAHWSILPEACEHDSTFVDNSVEATCTTEGYTGDVVCDECGSILEEGTVIPALDHTIITDQAIAPTCTSEGLTKGSHCSVCGEILVAQESLDMVEHSWDDGEVTIPATAEEPGVMTYTCIICEDTMTESIDPLPTEPQQPTTVQPVESEPVTADVILPFVDVLESDYFYRPVQWAVSRGITAGTSDTTFSPYESCTRGQIVTFLYAQAGKPEVYAENPFTDVYETDYYYNAVLWAVANGITAGTSDTTFSPNEICTRAQIVTFLYAQEGHPKVEGETPFVDVSESDYFYYPVSWAVWRTITAGTSDTTFSPYEECTRGQTVTFLYANAGRP